MSDGAAQLTIPARVTASQLAELLGLDVSAVQAVLTARGEPDMPGDLIDASLATETARALGFEVHVEPRDLALECLYEIDTRSPDQVREGIPPRVHRMVTGVMAEAESLDHDIEEASQHWSVARMPLLDRAILRLGLWELRNDPETPTAVVVSEAVRLANTYSTGRSGAFINGVLATLAKSTRTE
ncbi:MAG TPA: transcription antitermination factor NusB [Acidimicrobiia bacterium]|nr:transcription antitermination factor NusB [Acidimicrobiia bacterium]